MTLYKFLLMLTLLASGGIVSTSAFSQPTGSPPANNIQDDNRTAPNPFAEERMALQDFIERINEARVELSLNQPRLAQTKIMMAEALIPIILNVTPAQSRLTRVEFGGGLYANDLGQRKNYTPIETQSLENFSRPAGPRWIKSTRMESDAQIIYITIDLSNDKALTYLKNAEKSIAAGDLKDAESQLSELTDRLIKVGDNVPASIRARDYMILADNYITVGNFFGSRHSLERSNEYLDQMKSEETYKTYYTDIVALRKEIEMLQKAFSQMDAEQIKKAEESLKKWQTQISSWNPE